MTRAHRGLWCVFPVLCAGIIQSTEWVETPTDDYDLYLDSCNWGLPPFLNVTTGMYLTPATHDEMRGRCGEPGMRWSVYRVLADFGSYTVAAQYAQLSPTTTVSVARLVDPTGTRRAAGQTWLFCGLESRAWTAYDAAVPVPADEVATTVPGPGYIALMCSGSANGPTGFECTNGRRGCYCEYSADGVLDTSVESDDRKKRSDALVAWGIILLVLAYSILLCAWPSRRIFTCNDGRVCGSCTRDGGWDGLKVAKRATPYRSVDVLLGIVSDALVCSGLVLFVGADALLLRSETGSKWARETLGLTAAGVALTALNAVLSIWLLLAYRPIRALYRGIQRVSRGSYTEVPDGEGDGTPGGPASSRATNGCASLCNTVTRRRFFAYATEAILMTAVTIVDTEAARPSGYWRATAISGGVASGIAMIIFAGTTLVCDSTAVPGWSVLTIVLAVGAAFTYTIPAVSIPCDGIR
jgi:hypothetical protein